MNETIKLLQSHASVRKYTDKKIPKDVLIEIIKSGQSAATSSYIQATSVIRVTDKEKRKEIYNIAGKQQQILDASEFLILCADLNRSTSCCQKYDQTAQEGFSEHMIIATTDVSLFAQNMVIASESLGLGICYIGAIRNNPKVVNDVLELPKLVYPVFGLCLGYPDADVQVKPRLPLSVIMSENKYDNSNDWQEIQEYDKLVQEYYISRNANAKTSAWSEQMSMMLSKESRPHMKDFLKSKGFLIK